MISSFFRFSAFCSIPSLYLTVDYINPQVVDYINPQVLKLKTLNSKLSIFIYENQDISLYC